MRRIIYKFNCFIYQESSTSAIVCLANGDIPDFQFEFDGNIYEITVAASRRAYQMAKVQDPEIEENFDKVVCVAARQLFTKKVNYRIEEKQ